MSSGAAQLSGSIAREAGALQRSGFGNPGVVHHKGTLSDQERAYDVVTEVDFACEKLILERIREHSPDAVVLAEEGGICLRDPSAQPPALPEASDLWIVDPLDGTINFANGLPGFGVSIARYSEGRAVEGAIYDPLLDELFTFEHGAGAMLNGEPIHVGAREQLHEGIFGVGSAGRIFPDVVRKFRAWRRIGSAALSMAYVACGRFDAYATLGNLAPWDYAAGAPLILEAGGTLTDQQFDPWDYPVERWSGVVAANGTLHGQLRDAMALASAATAS